MPDWGWWVLGIVGFLLLVAIHDVFQRKKQILRTFPVIGHIRYWLIEAGPELELWEREQARWLRDQLQGPDADGWIGAARRTTVRSDRCR